MTNLQQPHNQEAIDVAASFRLALESIRNEQYQATTLPSLAFFQDWIASSQALQPGSASNPVQIFDDAPVKSDPDSVDVLQERPRQLLDPQPIVPENPTHILCHLHPAPGLGNSSPPSSSQPRLFSTSGSATTSVTPPSSNLSAISRPSVLHNNSQTARSRIRNPTVCSRCKQSGHVAEDHCSTCGETGHDFSAAHCYHCHRIGKCTTRYCVNTMCTQCNEIGHTANQHCQKCSLPTHGIADHCHVCDEVGCKAEKHCNVCEEVGHTSKDHCELCRDRGHTENDHCIKCKQLGHGFHACLESDPVSIELCWTCRSYGHHRDRCRYRHQDELRFKWAYQLNRKLMHGYNYCKCCREQGAPDRHKIKDCPKMTHRVGCLKKTHFSPECIQWMDRSRKKGSYADASTQADLAEYSTEIDPRVFEKSEEDASVLTYYPPPNIFTVTSVSTQTAFVRIPRDDETDPLAEIDPVLLGEQSPIKQEIAEIDPALLNEQSPIKQETTTLEEPEQETHNDDTVWNFEGDWRDYSRFIGPLRFASRTLRDDYWDDRVSQERPRVYSPNMIMPTQDQQETFEQVVMRRSSIDREERECGPSPDQSINPVVENPLTLSEWRTLRMAHSLLRHKMERDMSEGSDDLVIVDAYPPDPLDVQEGPCSQSPTRTLTEIREGHVPAFLDCRGQDSARRAQLKVIDDAWYAGIRQNIWGWSPERAMPETRNEHVSSAINRHAEDLPEEWETKVVDASSSGVQDGPYGLSPIRCFSEIRDAPIPSFVVHQASEVHAAVASSSTSGEKRPRKPTSVVQADKRQKTTSDPSIPRPAITSDTTQRKITVLADKRQTANLNLRSRLLAVKDTTQGTVNHERNGEVIVASSSKVQGGHGGPFSLGSMAEIQDGYVPPHILNHVAEPNVELTSSTAGEKRCMKTTSGDVVADNRQKTTSDLNATHLSTIITTTQQPSNHESNEGVVVASSSKAQEVTCDRSPIRTRTMTKTQNARVPSPILRHVPETEVASNSTGEKRSTKPKSRDVVADNRQETASSSSIPRPATTGTTTQDEGVASSSTAEKRPGNPSVTLPAEKRQKTISEPETSCLPTNDHSAQVTATRDLNAEITPSTVGEKRPRRIVAMVLIDKRQKRTSEPKTSHTATVSNTTQEGANKDLTEEVNVSESNAEVALDNVGDKQPRGPAPTVAADATLEPKTPCLGTASNTTQASVIQEPSVPEPIVEVAPSTIGEERPRIPTSTVLLDKRQKTDMDPKTSHLATTSDTSNITQTIADQTLNESAEKRQNTTSAPKTPRVVTTNTTPQGSANRESIDRVWLDHGLYIYWKDLCYMVIFDAPNQSTNLKQLYNLVSNWLRNCFPKHESIHNKADIVYLETIMHSSPYIATHKLKSASVETNPIEFSIRKNSILNVKILVRVFTHEFAKFRYQKCWKNYQFTDPGIKPRLRTSFENLIGIALHQSGTGCLTLDAIVDWISKNIDGYNCKGSDREAWIFGLREEIRASSFFEFGTGGLRFREGCGEFFDKRDPKVIFAVDPNSLRYQACDRQP